MDNLDQVEPNQGLDEEVMDSMGDPAQVEDENSSDSDNGNKTTDPLYVQKRLKREKRAHERELRELHAKVAELQSRVYQNPATSVPQETSNPYGENPYFGSDDDRIRAAVSATLRHKEMEEAKARQQAEQMQQAANLQRKYQELSKHLDDYADKYDDFEDKVLNKDVPITPHIVHAAAHLPKSGSGSAAETLYHLAKNPGELARISQLPSSDQISEVNALSHALARGKSTDTNALNSPKVLDQVKSMPVNTSRKVTASTPISELRARMRAGTFK
jgi:hypothetical protein